MKVFFRGRAAVAVSVSLTTEGCFDTHCLEPMNVFITVSVAFSLRGISGRIVAVSLCSTDSAEGPASCAPCTDGSKIYDSFSETEHQWPRRLTLQ